MQGGSGWLSASRTVLVLRKQRRLQGGRTGDNGVLARLASVLVLVLVMLVLLVLVL